MRYCIICGRGSGRLTTLLSFPNNENLRNQWTAFCKIECEDFKISHRLCSLHFDASAFKISVAKTGRRLKLRPEAVPTIFYTSGKSLPASGPTQNTMKVESKNTKVYLCCCLCGVLNSKIPRFSFPINYPKQTAKWLNVCGFKKEDLNVNLHKVCVKHFKNDDFFKRSSDKQRLLLKPGAVPSVLSNQLENGPSQKKKKVESKNTKVNLCCCLCGVLNSKIPLFSFPINYPKQTSKWLNICGLKKEDLNVNLHKVCIKHFKNDDFFKRTTDKKRLLLKLGAVPSVLSNQLENTILGNESLEEQCSSGSLNISSDIPNNQTEVGSTINFMDDCVNTDTTENIENQTLSKTKVSLPSKPNTPTSTLKRKFPRYVKDIKTSQKRK